MVLPRRFVPSLGTKVTFVPLYGPVHRGHAQLLNLGGMDSLAHFICQYSWQESQHTGLAPPLTPNGSKHLEHGSFSIFTSVLTTVNLGKGLGSPSMSMSCGAFSGAGGAANASRLCSASCNAKRGVIGDHFYFVVAAQNLLFIGHRAKPWG